MKIYTVILLLIAALPSLTSAQDRQTKNKQYQIAMMEAQAFAKAHLIQEIKGATGLNEFNLQVELEIDERKLKSVLGIIKDERNKHNGVQLPGLFMHGEEGNTVDLSLAKKEDLLISLKRIKINLSYHQDKYPKTSLESVLERIVTYNYPKLLDSQKELTVSKEATPYLEISNKQGLFVSFWDEHFKTIFLALLVFSALVVIVGFTLKLGLSRISDVIKSKNLASNDQGSRVTERNPSISAGQKPWQVSGPEIFESYMQASEHLVTLMTKESKVCNEIIILKLMVEDFIGLTILLDLLPKDKKELFFNNLDSKKRERFKDYILGAGSSILREEAKLKEETIKMIKLIKITALSPEDLYRIVLVDLIGSLQPHEAQALLSKCSDVEKAFVCDQIGPAQIALYLQTEVLAASDLELEDSDLSKEESVELIIKASGLRKLVKSHSKQGKFEQVYAQIETSKAELLADTIGISPSLRFEFLFASYEQEGLKYIQDMDYNNLSALFPLLTENMREKVLGSLPELLAERLKFSRKVINAESLKLKGEFYFYLKEISENDRSNALNNSSLAA